MIGEGAWGKDLVRNFVQLGALAAVCDPNPQALELASQFGTGASTCSSFWEVFRDPEIDALAIATPAATHFSVTKEALLAGKDAFVEKPLAL